MRPFWKKEEAFEDKLKYKIRADPSDHSLSITFSATIKKGMMVDLYTKMSKKFPGEKKEFDEIEAEQFDLPQKFLGLLHQKLTKSYRTIEGETKKDFLAQQKSFRITVLNTLSCSFTKNDKNEYDVLVKSEGYWSET